VDPTLGGDEALAELRRRLSRRGLRLVLDFVPNHLALDHAWVREHPERFVHGSASDLERAPCDYFVEAETILAHGRDPNFPGWTDTVQLDYRRPDTRRAMADVLLSIAERCDGVRCDMAMLVLRDVFLRTWGGCFEPELAEFWPSAIAGARARHPGFLFLAEAYWDLEWELQRQGFDYCYDKRLYDRLLASDAAAVAAHLRAPLDYQRGLARFVENHDERRAAEAFGAEASRAVAVLALTLPGLRLLHDGQLEGRRVRVPVQLGRRPPEPADAEMERFYRMLLIELRAPIFHDGDWQLLQPQDGDAGSSVIAHCWRLGDDLRVVAVNPSNAPARFDLAVDVAANRGSTWRVREPFNGATEIRASDAKGALALTGSLPPWGYSMCEISPAACDGPET
jgi:hypothetical protein